MAPAAAGADVAIEKNVAMPTPHTERLRLSADQPVEIAVQLKDPSALPHNARVKVEWKLVEADNPERVPGPPTTTEPARGENAEGIYTAPTADWSKLLHALDTDTYVVYRAPLSGIYELSVAPETGKVDLFAGERWRETGSAPDMFPVPEETPWLADVTTEVALSVREIDLPAIDAAADVGPRLVVETEPNDTPEMAQPLRLVRTSEEMTINVVGTSDDIEYFDNGKVGQSGDDWFRIDFQGERSRLLTMCLSIPDQQVAARIRAYRIPPDAVAKGNIHYRPGELLAIEEYKQGENPNEGVHQQEETHRTAINRTLEPGGVYFIRVEANAPGYDLELRLVDPAPFDDPQKAIRHAIYDHVSQVDAWLTNRPRGASIERRIRDSGNLLGTNCMSCHTQSGVWGPAVPFAQGYRPQNVQAWRHLINTSYQSMRPTNELVDAAVNTSLKPLDIGDGPAGSRVTGHAMTTLERYSPPRKLQSKQSLRAANYVLQTADPGGVNAAGPGANVGQGVVFNYTGEILYTAWQKTGDPKYFHALEEKVRKALGMRVKFSDDLGHRVELFKRFFPADYVDQAVKMAEREGLQAEELKKVRSEAEALARRMERRVERDLARLRAIQLEDGSWSFDPGRGDEEGGWQVRDTKPDPAPTALALVALHAAGVPKEDPAVARGIKALLAMQHPTGYWNAASKTGFVTTGYALHALSYYFPAEPPQHKPADFAPREQESLVETIRRMRQLSVVAQDDLAPLMIEGARHSSPLVRYWAMVGLGASRATEAPEVLAQGLSDRNKVVREAAHWGLRQQLIDDRGWDALFAAAESEDDITREAALRTLVMKVDGVLTESSVDWKRLVALLDRGLNDDPHPGARAWATRAGWQWWVWNPPVREGINEAWLRLLQREEPSALVENAIRYQSHALFIVNGHVANASEDHQYRELQVLFARLRRLMTDLSESDEEVHRRLVNRLVAVAATYYGQAGGDGGPGQIGYSTRGSDRLFGDALIAQLAYAESLPEGQERHLYTKVTLEGSANNTYEALQERLVTYSLEGPEDLRSIAAASISDPRLVRLVAVAEQLEPMHRQLMRGAVEPPRRKDLSDPILDMIRRVSWVLPSSDEQREEILQYFLPNFSAWQRPEAIAALTDAVAQAEVARQTDAVWYLAEGMGQAIEENPDLHFEELALSFPEKFENDAAARFWMRSVPWILTYKRDIPKVAGTDEPPTADPYEAIRGRALKLFIEQLGPEALPANRALAVELANKSALRRNPEVLSAMAKLDSYETDKAVLEDATKVLMQERGMFEQQLAEAIAKEGDSRLPKGPDGKPQITKEFVEDFVYFRDFVLPEMNNVLRGDDRSCFSCHGEPDRVPSLELHPPDEVGYIPIDKLLANYRILQQRVDLNNVDASKLLRKPLNVQTGQEDGHQGGRRYQPMDPGYQILKTWAENQAELHSTPQP